MSKQTDASVARVTKSRVYIKHQVVGNVRVAVVSHLYLDGEPLTAALWHAGDKCMWEGCTNASAYRVGSGLPFDFRFVCAEHTEPAFQKAIRGS